MTCWWMAINLTKAISQTMAIGQTKAINLMKALSSPQLPIPTASALYARFASDVVSVKATVHVWRSTRRLQLREHLSQRFSIFAAQLLPGQLLLKIKLCSLKGKGCHKKYSNWKDTAVGRAASQAPLAVATTVDHPVSPQNRKKPAKCQKAPKQVKVSNSTETENLDPDEDAENNPQPIKKVAPAKKRKDWVWPQVVNFIEMFETSTPTKKPILIIRQGAENNSPAFFHSLTHGSVIDQAEKNPEGCLHDFKDGVKVHLKLTTQMKIAWVAQILIVSKVGKIAGVDLHNPPTSLDTFNLERYKPARSKWGRLSSSEPVQEKTDGASEDHPSPKVKAEPRIEPQTIRFFRRDFDGTVNPTHFDFY
ncbi:hypothetical protein BJ741DRAFT_582962 [Chytriomyces cf. hyalinus JEL632]|nr:hypothetical protein BJ741DRAFT_582962 [Chytriomyces cf. hyalinus JEL632]